MPAIRGDDRLSPLRSHERRARARLPPPFVLPSTSFFAESLRAGLHASAALYDTRHTGFQRLFAANHRLALGFSRSALDVRSSSRGHRSMVCPSSPMRPPRFLNHGVGDLAVSSTAEHAPAGCVEVSIVALSQVAFEASVSGWAASGTLVCNMGMRFNLSSPFGRVFGCRHGFLRGSQYLTHWS
jgi:hypothetical protein